MEEVDENLQEAFAVILEQRLHIMSLDSEIMALREENKRLKDSLQEVMTNETIIMHKSQHRISQDVRDKWACYHENKKEVAASMTNPKWRDIKRETDKIYYARLEAQKT